MPRLVEGNSAGADAAMADGTRNIVSVIVVEEWDQACAPCFAPALHLACGSLNPAVF